MLGQGPSQHSCRLLRSRRPHRQNLSRCRKRASLSCGSQMCILCCLAPSMLRHCGWFCLHCVPLGDRCPSWVEDRRCIATRRFSQGNKLARSAGEPGVECQPVLRRRLHLPFQKNGPAQASRMGRHRHGFDDEVARGKSFHLAADPRWRRSFIGDPNGDAGRWIGLDPRTAKCREATHWSNVRSGRFYWRFKRMCSMHCGWRFVSKIFPATQFG